jgi:hypothetical protein
VSMGAVATRGDAVAAMFLMKSLWMAARVLKVDILGYFLECWHRSSVYPVFLQGMDYTTYRARISQPSTRSWRVERFWIYAS